MQVLVQMSIGEARRSRNVLAALFERGYSSLEAVNVPARHQDEIRMDLRRLTLLSQSPFARRHRSNM
jgi:hypothetical protein